MLPPLQSSALRLRRSTLRRRLPLLLSAIAACWLATSFALLRRHAQNDAPPAGQATAAVLLALSAAAQLGLAWRSHKQGGSRHDAHPRLDATVPWLLVGLAVAYAISLGTAIDNEGELVFLPLAAGWTTALAALFVATPARLAGIAAAATSRRGRAAGWALGIVALSPVGAELGLRAWSQWATAPLDLAGRAAALKLASGAERNGLAVNAQGYWDEDFTEEVPPGLFRVAVVGDDVAVGGTPQTNFLSQVEKQDPRLQLYNFGLPGAGPRDYAAQAGGELPRYRPQLTLVVLSLAEDLAQTPAASGWFQREALVTWQLSQGWLGAAAGPALRSVAVANDRTDARFDRAARELAACRTPISPAMQARWNGVFAELDLLIARLKEAQTPVALVLAPSEFQVSAPFRDTVRRRAGLAPHEVDAELPQRRLVSYARDQNVLVLDLLPALRACEESTFERSGAGLNARGHQVAADVVGHWVTSQFHSLISTTAQVRR